MTGLIEQWIRSEAEAQSTDPDFDYEAYSEALLESFRAWVESHPESGLKVSE